MECNKEEAIRAKGIAEMKMKNGDFVGARRFGLKARQLYPDLDNISQLLMVCEVHCSAQNKLNGSEMDWYGILQIEQFSDESVVKKQFRKLALSLHPDKNKFAGAEAAFKLIGEANRVLMDPTKRSVYDMKCRSALRQVAPKITTDHSNRSSVAKKQHGAANKFSSGPHTQYTSSRAYQQPQQPTFWTSCPSCSMRYEYHREHLNKTLRCQRCHHPFIAHDFGIPSGSWFFKEKRVPNHGGPSKVMPQKNAGKPSGVSFPNRFSGSDPVPKTGKAVDVGGGSKPKEVKVENVAEIGGGSKPQEKMNGHVDLGAGKRGFAEPMPSAMKPKESGISRSSRSKRGRTSVEESNDNFDKGKDAGSEENMVIKENGSDLFAQNSRHTDSRQSRRSLRQKQHVSYKDNVSDDDFVGPPPKRSRGSSLSGMPDVEMKKSSADGNLLKEDISAGSAAALLNRNNKEVKQKASSSLEERSSNKNNKTGDFNAKVLVEEASVSEKAGIKLENNDEKSNIEMFKSNSNEALKPEIFVCPDADFTNFENVRAENSFAVNQVWAIYDSLDGMPRFYAWVKKVYTPGFKLGITWLEAISDNKAEKHWCDADLPVGCGMYETGNSEKTVDRQMFSHLMCMNAGRKGTYLIYPKKGETWALFKDWDIGWSSDPEKHKPPYQFEFVEVLTDFKEDVGIGVAYLGKVKGFVSIFERAHCNDVVSFCIRPSELYRFSHRIPSFKLTGQEGKGVPQGSFELDTAALPNSLFDLGDKVGKEKLATEVISSYSMSSEHKLEPVKGSRKICSPKNFNTGPEEGASALRRSLISPEESTGTCSDGNQVSAGQQAKAEDVNKVSNHELDGIYIPFQDIEKITAHKKQEKRKPAADALTPRRSPRDLSKRNNQASASQSTTEDANKHVAANGDDGHGQPGASLCQPDDKMHLDVEDGSLVSRKEGQKSSGCRVIEVERYDFKKEKSEDKFQVNQIWALLDDRDGLPRNYAQVKKIESTTAGLRLHVVMLEACSLRKDKKQPVACGTFKVKNKIEVLSVAEFSHRVKEKPVGKNRYEIYPRKGEIWAVYKSWNAELMCSDKSSGECDIVEVVEDNESAVKVVVLKRVNGSEYFYMAPRRLKSGFIDIPRNEFARFSHQCLASQHAGEKDNRLKGSWELDPSSIPGSVILVE